MRNAIVPLALLLALATGGVLSELRLTVLDPLGADGASASASANAASVRKFYEAVNRTIFSGDAGSFGDLLTSEFVEHTVRPGQTNDAKGLVRFLQLLHRTAPSLLLTGYDLVAQGDRVTAFVRVEGATGTSFIGLPVVAGRAWGEIDVFRLQSGRIVEHWGEATGLATVEPLLSIAVPVEPPATKMVELARQTYPPQAADRHWASGLTILTVESGALVVELDALSTDAATAVRTTGASMSVASGAAVTLAAGDSLVLGRRSLYETRNEGATEAVARTLWAGDPTFPNGVAGTSTAGDDSPDGPTSRTTYQALAGSLAVLPPDRANVTVGRISLAPGAVLSRHRIANVELVVVESGSLDLTVEGGTAWVRDSPNVIGRAETDAVLAAGSGLALEAGTTVAIRPAGDEPLTILLIAIEPTADEVSARLDTR